MGYTDIILSQPPKGGGYIDLKNKIGHRLVFLGTHSIEKEADNLNPGETRDVATVDYIDLDDGQGGVIQWGARVDKVGVVNKLRGQRNAIMGRLILGDAKAGKSAPFILADHEPQDADYFFNTWIPANKAALEGKEQQNVPAAGQVAPGGYADYVPAPAATAAFPGQVLPAPQPLPQPLPQPMPQMPQMPQPVPQASSPWWAAAPQAQPAPAAAAAAQPAQQVAAALANGQTGPYPPEAIAALERMMASGQIPAFPAAQ